MDIRKFFGAKKASAAPAAAPAASAPKGAAAAAPKSTPAGAEKRKKGSPPAQQGAGKKAKGAPEGSPEPTPVSSSQGSKGSESGSKSRFFGGSDKKPSPRASGASGRSAASPRPAVAYTAADEEADKGVAWKWQFHTQMKPFDAASTDKLNRGWKSYKAGRGGQSKMSITIRNEEYTIDFDQMDQTNVETGNKRTIKRIMPKPEPKPKPKPVKQEKVKQEKVAPAPAKASSSASAASAPAKPRASGGGNPNWRGGAGKAPPQQGLKHINKGAPNCLKNKCFLITGVLDSLDREDCEKLIQKYGGTISKSVPKKKKLDYAIIGEDAGPSKLKKLDEKPETKQIDENGLLTMLRDSLSPEDKAKEPEVGTMITPDLDIATVSVKGTSATPATNAANTASIAASAASAAAVASGPAPVKVPPNPAHSLWTEKYKPKTTKDLVGNFQVVNKVNNWLKIWSSPQSPPEKRAVLMAGPPGYGKTSMAHVMLNTVGYEVMEFNASDVRSKKAVGNQIEDITNSRSMSEFFSAGGKQVKKVAVIMDEVDGMSSGDRGGIQELIRIIVASKVPIICCCNDESHEKVRTLKKYCIPLVFAKPIYTQVAERIKMVAEAEGMNVDNAAIEKLYHGCNGDLRQMITSLQMWSNDGASLTGAGISERLKTQHKEVLTKNIVDVVKEVFDGPSEAKPRGPTVNDRLDSYFMDIDMAPMWTHEVYPRVVSSINCQGRLQQAKAIWYMSRCADSISDSDIVQQQIRGAQNWGLLPLHGLTSTAKVGALLGNIKGAGVNPQFPMLLGQISKGNKRERILREAAMHTSGIFTGGAQGLRMDYFGPLRQHLVEPLRRRGAAAVPEVIEMLDEFHMSKDDWDTLVAEFGFKGLSAEYDKQIDGKVRAAFTRQYNKTHQEVTKVKKSAAEREDVGGGSDYEDEDEDEDNLVVNKAKKKKAAAKKPNKAKANAKRKSGGASGGGKKRK